MKSNKIRFILCVVIAGLLGYFVGVSKIAIDWKNFQPHIEISSKEPPPSLQRADFTQFWNVMEKIENTYYDKKAIDSQKMLNGAISGMVDSLDDPYTMYLPPKQNDDFKQGLAGKFEGIGAELGMKGKQIIVVSPLDGSPAKRGGLKPEDAILKVDDQITAGWNLNQAVEKIRGPKGTKVKLTIVHKSDSKPVEITLTRDTITVKSITTWTKKVKDIEEINPKSAELQGMGDQKVIYIRLSQFGDTANEEWLSAANRAASELRNDKGIKGVILDLRNNPGGYLTDAVYIASEFIKSGVVVMQEDKNGARQSLSVNRAGLLTNIPLVVLVNKGSASASEIVSGALRDHNRAKLVGETSFGKGTIQQAEDLGGGAGIHVTVAKWLTPNGIWVHKKGLEPDVKAELDTKDQEHDAQLEKAVSTLITSPK